MDSEDPTGQEYTDLYFHHRLVVRHSRTRPYIWVAGVRVALNQALNIQFRIYLDTLCTHHLTLPYHWGRKWVMLSQGKPLEFVLKTSYSPTSYLIFSDANNGYIIPIPIFGIPSGNRIPYHFSAGQGNEVTSGLYFRSATSIIVNLETLILTWKHRY